MDKSDTQSTVVDVGNLLPAPAHTLSSDKVLQALASDARRGLSHSAVASLQQKHGPNVRHSLTDRSFAHASVETQATTKAIHLVTNATPCHSPPDRIQSSEPAYESR